MKRKLSGKTGEKEKVVKGKKKRSNDELLRTKYDTHYAIDKYFRNAYNAVE